MLRKNICSIKMSLRTLFANLCVFFFFFLHNDTKIGKLRKTRREDPSKSFRTDPKNKRLKRVSILQT